MPSEPLHSRGARPAGARRFGGWGHAEAPLSQQWDMPALTADSELTWLAKMREVLVLVMQQMSCSRGAMPATQVAAPSPQSELLSVLICEAEMKVNGLLSRHLW